MAHAFDNQNLNSEKKQAFYSTNSSSNDLSYYQKQQSLTGKTHDDYLRYTSENVHNETKPPPPTRTSRITSITNNNYIRRPNLSSQNSINGTKSNTTYLTATQVYINPPTSKDQPQPSPPPPPPPRYPLHPPVIPPRNSINSHQKNSIIIPDFNSSNSSKTIYRSSIDSSIIEKDQFTKLSLENTHQNSTNESTIREYFGNCRKCGETITSLDDPCDILGDIYHSYCAICVICKQSVKNKHFFIKDQLYCEEDFLKTDFYQSFEHCIICNQIINDTIIQALGQSYHLSCFKCSKCSICLDGRPFLKDKYQNLFCLHDYYMTYGLRCDKCKKPIYPEDNSNETVRIVSMGKNFHIKCYQCQDCSIQLGDEQNRLCHPLDNILLCQQCCRRRLNFINKF